MKLLTHNILKSNVKGVKVGYPLMLRASKIETLSVPYSPEFVKNMLPRIEYAVLKAAAAAVRASTPPLWPSPFVIGALCCSHALSLSFSPLSRSSVNGAHV